MLHPLPPQLENLPLYLDDDGFYSVNGPRFHANHSQHPTAHLLDNQIFKPVSQSPNTSSNPHQPPINGLNKLEIPLCTSAPCIRILAPPPQSQPNPRKFAQGEYICNEPDCAWKYPFPTKQGLTRHHEVKHLQKRFDCPIPGCESVGSRGIKRMDNLRAHVWNQHRVELPHESRRNHT
ncbi:hypothetical protein B9Z19DRAFT_419184 [Tuber borchii]|uniref:C2H2-type domain-containing protein n=1 Tax=Tuber borchii TaxID=42251 RepID=A0A2T6ZGS7_TUBBO|nr:hypothetical protein B9Z19DRAFT_419184 [Tuber borchii]